MLGFGRSPGERQPVPEHRKGGSKDVKRLSSAAGVRPLSLVIPWVEKGRQREGKLMAKFQA